MSKSFTYDPTRHPPEVKRVLDRMTSLIKSGKRSHQDVVGALTEAMEFVAGSDGVSYDSIRKVVFDVINQDKPQ